MFLVMYENYFDLFVILWGWGGGFFFFGNKLYFMFFKDVK